MAHITSIGASKFTTLDYVANTAQNANSSAADLHALFVSNSSTILATNTATDETLESAVKHVGNIREFPSLGTPANIVNVPVYGQKTSSQVQGQADAPSLEITVNYVAEDMTDFHALIDGNSKVFRFMMCATPVTEAEATGQATLAVNNTEFYFTGKVEAILVNPALTDATTATITLSAQTDFVGPATLAAS